VIHPASTTHQSSRTPTGRCRRDSRPDQVVVGLEDVEDVLWDIDQALAEAVKDGDLVQPVSSGA